MCRLRPRRHGTGCVDHCSLGAAIHALVVQTKLKIIRCTESATCHIYTKQRLQSTREM